MSETYCLGEVGDICELIICTVSYERTFPTAATTTWSII